VRWRHAGVELAKDVIRGGGRSEEVEDWTTFRPLETCPSIKKHNDDQSVPRLNLTKNHIMRFCLRTNIQNVDVVRKVFVLHPQSVNASIESDIEFSDLMDAFLCKKAHIWCEGNETFN
jgi:hypothetical protein